MNPKKLFAKLLEQKIYDAEYRYLTTASFNCEVFRGELSNYGASTTSIINVDTVIDNKLAMVTSENTSNNNIDNIIQELIESSKYTNKKDAEIFKKKCKYRHYQYFNKELSTIDNEKKINTLFEIEKKLKAMDSRIIEVEVGYNETEAHILYQNTSNIRLKSKKNEYSFSAAIVIKDNEEKQTEFLTFIDNDFNKFKVDDFVKELYEKVCKKLNGVSIETKKYRTIFDPEVVDTLLECYISQLNAEKVLKNSSWFKDKLNTQVANKRITILETPLKRDADFTGFDSQGVPCVNRPLIKKGVLLTYLHNLETARKFNVEPSGNATVAGTKIGIKPNATHLKPGRLSKDELIKKVNNGIYITSLEGLHAGMNVESGDFSLKAEGYVIKDGKIDKFIKMMTVAANLYEIFNNVKAISENIEYLKTDVFAPCIYLDRISISC